MAKAKLNSFPQEIFVVREYDGDDSWLVTYSSITDIADDEVGNIVAIYHFQTTGVFAVTKGLNRG